MTNYECETMAGVCTQEEADTRMIDHAVEVASNGTNVHIKLYSLDTDVLLLALRRAPLLGNHSASIPDPSGRRRSLRTAYMTSLPRRNQEL